MNKCVGHVIKPKDQAIADLMSEVEMAPTLEKVSLSDAVGRVAWDDVFALHTLPNMQSSRMDGIAVRFADFENGTPDTSTWKEGNEFVFCNCGVGFSDKYDTTIRIEDVDYGEDHKLVINKVPTERGQWVTPPGSSVKKGDQLVRKGDILTPYLISKLATGGYSTVDVIRKPVVAFIPTGNELVPAGEEVPSGMNVDSNSLMARAKIVLWGGEPLIYPIQKDDPDQLLATVTDALDNADIVVINAGSSQGRLDFTVDILNKVGKVLSHIIMNGPGAHTSCTVANNGKPIIGIPGPAIGAEMTIDWFLRPMMLKYLGQPTASRHVKAIYDGEEIPYEKPSNGWHRIGRGQLSRDDNGTLHVISVPFNDSAASDLANCLPACIPK